jgi:transposase
MTEDSRKDRGDEQDLSDVQAEEASRGRKQPVRAVSLERQRMIRRIARLLADLKCDRETYLETIREFGLTDESPEYRQLLALWRKRHGNE